MTSITAHSSWSRLKEHAVGMRETPIAGLFEKDASRFENLSFSLPGLFADFSKNIVTRETLTLLCTLAREARLEDRRREMFSGEKINITENRAVLHTALRAPKDAIIAINGENIVPGVQETLRRMENFCDSVRNGDWKGHNGKEITDIVNIGIGGSSLGPELASAALSSFHHPRLKSRYVANVEASSLALALQGLSPETTLFVIASKTFTTAETMQNAHIARDWLLAHAKDEKAVARHFVAASTNAQAVAHFGIAPENMFPFADWVGGRYSVWSSIGLSVMLMIGPENFSAFLSGAQEMDTHFLTAPLERNIPALMGLVGLWHRDFLDFPACAVIPYHTGLSRLPAFLQQLDMESNGKSVTREGKPVVVPTGPVIFGEPGTDAQHSFFQWLHQGTDIVPVDFIATIKTPFGNQDQQDMLLANCLAQSAALMSGQKNPAEPHRHFPGNRPSTTLLLDELSPRTLGMLLALYEHKVFVQGVLWDINSFDQWGVELGKTMAKSIAKSLKTGDCGNMDVSTQGLVRHIRDI